MKHTASPMKLLVSCVESEFRNHWKKGKICYDKPLDNVADLHLLLVVVFLLF